jgi:arylformamidase
LKIYDLTAPVSPSLVVWQGDPPVGLSHVAHLDQGDDYTVTRMNMGAHTGTHVDAPAHFVRGGAGVEALALNALVGPVQVVDAGEAAVLTGDVLDALPIDPTISRIVFRTSNSERLLMEKSEFVEDYVALDSSGASWVVEHHIRLVGIDYLSISAYHDLIPPHQILLGAGVIPVEGLLLEDIEPGLYQLFCLPLKLAGSDGAPARVILLGDD